MGKLYKELQKQIKLGIQIEDARDCLKIYKYLSSISKGSVWSSDWRILVTVKFIGKYPYDSVYSPTTIGKTLLKGIT